MTDVSPADDELISSYLDHEATPEDAARVENEPHLTARVDEMRAAIAFVDTPPVIPEADLDRIRATAVAAFEAQSGPAAAAAPAVDMAAARAKRLERRNRLLAVAAAVVLFGGIVAGIASLDTDDDDSATDSADDAGSDDGGDDGSLDALGSANDGADFDMGDSADMSMDAEMEDMDTASDESVEAEGDDEAGSDDAADDVSADSGPAIRMQKTASFDPLPDDLGVFATVDELVVATAALVDEMTIDEESDFAPDEFLPFTTCEETLAVALAADAALDVDTAQGVVDARLHTIVVGRKLDTGEFVGRLAPSDTCSPATELFIAP